jgi:hypothetical protein
LVKNVIFNGYEVQKLSEKYNYPQMSKNLPSELEACENCFEIYQILKKTVNIDLMKNRLKMNKKNIRNNLL